MPWPTTKRVNDHPPTRGVGRLLAGMRIRKKLIVLHTCFSLVLAGVLALALRPALREVVDEAEAHEASVLLDLVLAERARLREADAGPHGPADVARLLQARLGPSVRIRSGPPESVGLTPRDAERLRGQTYGGIARERAEPEAASGEDAGERGREIRAGEQRLAAAYDPASGEFVTVAVTLTGARRAVVRLYLLVTAALLAVYFLVALALELFVLPQHVYGPIRAILRADEAVREGRADAEIIPEAAMPRDEVGSIMRSRNSAIRALRRHEADLAAALQRLEEVAADLRRKNHLLEMARRNLADADRLASLGMMSAGIAHELNTPLAVLKGMVERLHAAVQREAAAGRGQPSAAPGIGPEEAALMLRVVGRLERLSESLLDFARVRPHHSQTTPLRPLVEEAWTLVRLDREAREVEFENRIPADLTAWCDPDRIVQVLVNLLRNAVDAMHQRPASGAPQTPREKPRIVASAERLHREGRPWASVRITDNGPGIPAETLARLFQPFVSTRLDAKGTGLGLAVAHGIVREHGGLLMARNRSDAAASAADPADEAESGRVGSGGSAGGGGGGGAEFEMLLPEADDVAGTPAALAAGTLPLQ